MAAMRRGKCGGDAEESLFTRQVKAWTVSLCVSPSPAAPKAASGGARFFVQPRCFLTCVTECVWAGAPAEEVPLANGVHEVDDAVATFRADELATDAACRAAIHQALLKIPLLGGLAFGAGEGEGEGGASWERVVPSDLVEELAAAVRAYGGGGGDYTFAPILEMHRRLVYSQPKELVMKCKKKMAAAKAAKQEDHRCVHDEDAAAAAATCPICMDAMSKEGKGSAVELPGCTHAFHSRCITKWFHRATTCPMCRSNVKDSIDL